MEVFNAARFKPNDFFITSKVKFNVDLETGREIFCSIDINIMPLEHSKLISIVKSHTVGTTRKITEHGKMERTIQRDVELWGFTCDLAKIWLKNTCRCTFSGFTFCGSITFLYDVIEQCVKIIVLVRVTHQNLSYWFLSGPQDVRGF